MFPMDPLRDITFLALDCLMDTTINWLKQLCVPTDPTDPWPVQPSQPQAKVENVERLWTGTRWKMWHHDCFSQGCHRQRDKTGIEIWKLPFSHKDKFGRRKMPKTYSNWVNGNRYILAKTKLILQCHRYDRGYKMYNQCKMVYSKLVWNNFIILD